MDSGDSLGKAKNKKIYGAKITFRKSFEGERTVRVNVRYSKKGKARKLDFPFPKGMDERDLCWVSYGGERIAIYHRKNDNYHYTDMEHSKIPTVLAQKLEELVREAF